MSQLGTQVNALGSLSECLSGEDATKTEDLSTPNWPASYRFRLDPGDSCYYLAHMTVKVDWESSQHITVKTQTYRHPVGSEVECQPDQDNLDYYANDELYTSQTPWPNVIEDICAWMVVITNDDQENEMVFDLYTNGAVGGLLYGSVALLLSSLLLF